MSSIPSQPRRLLPLVLAPIIVLADQVSKAVFLSTLPYGVPVEVIGDFFRLTLVQNPAIAFSIGHGLPAEVRRPLFLVLPLAVVAFILLYYLRTAELTQLQRWLVAAVLGGGVANFVDRVFRPAGVVDFIDLKFYGLLGWARFPTFNVADSSVVVGGILLLLAFLRDELRTKRRELL